MPLQEARRQRRQRCGEGVVALDLIAQGPHDDRRRPTDRGEFSARAAARRRVGVDRAGGSGSAPSGGARAVRRDVSRGGRIPSAARRRSSSCHWTMRNCRRAISTRSRTWKSSCRNHSLVAERSAIVNGQRKGTPQTFGEVMALWERLHAPFLAEADAERDLVRQIERYRLTDARRLRLRAGASEAVRRRPSARAGSPHRETAT